MLGLHTMTVTGALQWQGLHAQWVHRLMYLGRWHHQCLSAVWALRGALRLPLLSKDTGMGPLGHRIGLSSRTDHI